MKQCFKCGISKPMSDFYQHPQMADGHLGKCKECTRRDVRERTGETSQQRREYELRRNATARRKRQRRAYTNRQRAIYPAKYKARTAVGNALRDGKLHKQSCEVCGAEKVEAHHEDYSKPLEVRWLCHKHHREVEGKTVDNVGS